MSVRIRIFETGRTEKTSVPVHRGPVPESVPPFLSDSHDPDGTTGHSGTFRYRTAAKSGRNGYRSDTSSRIVRTVRMRENGSRRFPGSSDRFFRPVGSESRSCNRARTTGRRQRKALKSCDFFAVSGINRTIHALSLRCRRRRRTKKCFRLRVKKLSNLIKRIDYVE